MGERESPQSIFSSASSSYVPGYDSSAPPLPTHTSEPGPHERFGYNHGWEENNNGAVPPYYQTPVQENDLGNGQWGYPYPQENQVLGLRLIDVIGGAFSSLWRASHTVLRLDLRRGIRWDGPKLRGKQRSGQFVTTQRSHGEPPRNNWETERASSKWVQGIQGGGARIKLTQIWDFPSKETGEPGLPWGLNVGFGANIEMDRGGHLVPKARLKTKYAALHVLPSPCFELRSKFPLGGTSLAVNVRYRPAPMPVHRSTLKRLMNKLPVKLLACIKSPICIVGLHKDTLCNLPPLMGVPGHPQVLSPHPHEMFINELTLRAWILTEENKPRTLHKNDIAAAITRTDAFDFLVDIVPQDDFKDEVLRVGTAAPMMRSTAHAPPVPYYYVPQHQQHSLPHAAMIVGNSVEPRAVYSQQPRSPVAYQQMWQQAHLAQHSKSPSSGS
eukprot:Gb_41158 [translate_table: standard]